MAKRFMTVSEFAEKPGVLYQSAVSRGAVSRGAVSWGAVSWARRGHIPGVKITQYGKFKIYMIPEDAKPPELPTGRPPKKDGAKNEVWNDLKDSMKPLYRPRSTGARRCAGAGRRRD